jgi:hypothetical protein
MKYRRCPVSAGNYVQWHDLFVIIDDGAIPVRDYDRIEVAMTRQAELCPDGLACLVILPPGARPPPDDVKERIKQLLTTLGPRLSCLAYVIEGTGFKAVAARAALIAMKIFSSRSTSYAIYVETSMHTAIGTVMRHLKQGSAVPIDVTTIVDNIAKLRRAEPLLDGTKKPVSK